MKKKLLIPIMILILVIGAVGGTLAWLTDKTDPVTNTFTVGNVDITLAETTGKTYKMVPGQTITKDPKVTVEAGSEECWLFVKIEKSTNYDNFMTYTVANGWTALGDAYPDVYYRSVPASTTNAEFAVLDDNKVTVKDTVTKAMMDEITKGTANAPTLTFTAYAVQSAGFDTAVEAWGEASK